MRGVIIAAFFFLASPVVLAETPDPLCVINRAEMPESWRPSAKLEKTLNPQPWSASEAKDAVNAIETGLNQIIRYYEKHPGVVKALRDDAVSSLVEVSYSGANMPKFQAMGRTAARKNLTKLIGPYLTRKPKTATCKDYERVLPLTIFTNSLFEKNDPRIATMVAFTNAAYRKCGSLKAAMATDYRVRLKEKNPRIEDIFNLIIWSTWMIEAELVPNLEMPEGASEFPPALWRYLETFPLPDAPKQVTLASRQRFADIGYLATHIAFIPTGYQRHPIYIEDSPELYRFIRRNFYWLMEMDEGDLLAEFIDTLRQYGCNDENDLQVRDGARYMLNLFHSYGDDWMAYPEPRMAGMDVEHYDLIHKAWTGIASVRVRVPEPADPGTYGGQVRRWLPHPR